MLQCWHANDAWARRELQENLTSSRTTRAVHATLRLVDQYPGQFAHKSFNYVYIQQRRLLVVTHCKSHPLDCVKKRLVDGADKAPLPTTNVVQVR